jgi:hypothetical protein
MDPSPVDTWIEKATSWCSKANDFISWCIKRDVKRHLVTEDQSWFFYVMIRVGCGRPARMMWVPSREGREPLANSCFQSYGIWIASMLSTYYQMSAVSKQPIFLDNRISMLSKKLFPLGCGRMESDSCFILTIAKFTIPSSSNNMSNSMRWNACHNRHILQTSHQAIFTCFILSKKDFEENPSRKRMNFPIYCRNAQWNISRWAFTSFW